MVVAGQDVLDRLVGDRLDDFEKLGDVVSELGVHDDQPLGRHPHRHVARLVQQSVGIDRRRNGRAGHRQAGTKRSADHEKTFLDLLRPHRPRSELAIGLLRLHGQRRCGERPHDQRGRSDSQSSARDHDTNVHRILAPCPHHWDGLRIERQKVGLRHPFARRVGPCDVPARRRRRASADRTYVFDHVHAPPGGSRTDFLCRFAGELQARASSCAGRNAVFKYRSTCAPIAAIGGI